MRFRLLLLFALLFPVLPLDVSVSVAEACPMCKEANDSDNNLPKAYMYSILFMLTVPAMIFTGFGIGFYRLSKMQPEEIDPAVPHPDNSEADGLDASPNADV